MGAELSHADRRTDMAKLIVAFCNSVKALKKATVVDIGTLKSNNVHLTNRSRD
jgi:hypothetical protein